MQAALQLSTNHFPKPKRPLVVKAIVVFVWAVFLIGYGPNAYRLSSDISYISDRSASANQITLEVSRDMDVLEACNGDWKEVGKDNAQKRLDGVAECVVKHSGRLQTPDGMLFAAKMLFLLNRDPAARLKLIQRANTMANTNWMSHRVCLALADQQDFWKPWPFQRYDEPALRCK